MSVCSWGPQYPTLLCYYSLPLFETERKRALITLFDSLPCSTLSGSPVGSLLHSPQGGPVLDRTSFAASHPEHKFWVTQSCAQGRRATPAVKTCWTNVAVESSTSCDQLQVHAAGGRISTITSRSCPHAYLLPLACHQEKERSSSLSHAGWRAHLWDDFVLVGRNFQGTLNFQGLEYLYAAHLATFPYELNTHLNKIRCLWHQNECNGFKKAFLAYPIQPHSCKFAMKRAYE